MPLHIIPGLTTEAANRICMSQCKAMCCRGPLILRLTDAEVSVFDKRAAALGVPVHITRTADGGESVRFSEHDGDRCPMLDDATSACRIYEDRPQRCRDFPERVVPGCAISGG